MKPNKLCSIFLSGDASTEVSLQCALYWAELGEIVWFISPKALDTLPNIWSTPPDKEILKLMLFIYIPETKDLLIKLSDIHLVPKIPKVIIIMDIEHYWCMKKVDMNFSNAAYVIACLQDALSSYIAKFNEPAFLITATNSPVSSSKLFQIIIDLYFSNNLFYTVTENREVFNEITEIFKNSKINI